MAFRIGHVFVPMPANSPTGAVSGQKAISRTAKAFHECLQMVDTVNCSPYLAIMGDPTLRLYRIPPPANVTSSTNSPGNPTFFTLNWSTSSGTTYQVYGGNSKEEPFTSLTNTTSGTYTDSPRHYDFYMTRAVKLLTTASSGTYSEVSQGVAKP